MDKSHKKQPVRTRHTREADSDIVAGAQKTPEMKEQQERSRNNKSNPHQEAGTPAVVHVDNGQRCNTLCIAKPISARGHALMDYALVASLLILPSALGLNKKVKRIYAAQALVLLPYVALTDQPLAVKKLIPFKTHGMIDIFNVAEFASLTLLKTFRKSNKATLFNIGFTALAGLTVLLTDWKKGQGNTGT